MVPPASARARVNRMHVDCTPAANPSESAQTCSLWAGETGCQAGPAVHGTDLFRYRIQLGILAIPVGLLPGADGTPNSVTWKRWGKKSSGRRRASRVGCPSLPERPAGLELSRCRNPADWIAPGWQAEEPPEVGLPNEKLRATVHRVLAYRNIKQNNRSHPIKFITLILLLPTT